MGYEATICMTTDFKVLVKVSNKDAESSFVMKTNEARSFGLALAAAAAEVEEMKAQTV